MGILSQDIDTNITPERLKELGFEFHVSPAAISVMMQRDLPKEDRIEKAYELSKQFSFYKWCHQEHKYKYKLFLIRYYPDTSVVNVNYNGSIIPVAGCVVAFQHSLNDVIICQKVNCIMDINAALAYIEQCLNCLY